MKNEKDKGESHEGHEKETLTRLGRLQRAKKAASEAQEQLTNLKRTEQSLYEARGHGGYIETKNLETLRREIEQAAKNVTATTLELAEAEHASRQ